MERIALIQWAPVERTESSSGEDTEGTSGEDRLPSKA